jgi:hypothetical protein
VTYEKLSIAPGGHVEGSFRHKSSGTLKKEDPQDSSLKLVDQQLKTPNGTGATPQQPSKVSTAL